MVIGPKIQKVGKRSTALQGWFCSDQRYYSNNNRGRKRNLMKLMMVYLIGCNVLNGPEGAVVVRHITQQSRARDDIKRSFKRWNWL